jgi:hydrogenase/urease accessory protein HupE
MALRLPIASPVFSSVGRSWVPLRRAFSILLVFLLVASGRAHDPGLSTAEIQITAEGLSVRVSFSPADARLLLPNAARLNMAEAPDAVWVPVAQTWCYARINETEIISRSVGILVNSRDTLRFELRYPIATKGHVILEMPRLSVLPTGHRQFAIVTEAGGRPVAKQFLTRAAPRMEFDVPGPDSTHTPDTPLAPQAAPMAFGGFLWLGVEHIWTGYDHLLFLFALLVVCRSFRSVATIISCFTLAHSLTLAVATLNVVTLPPRFVEPAIAASIVFVAVENLMRRGAEPRGRAALTFAFGLVHGFGFASVLRDLGLGGVGAGVALPLFAFNAGVEIGQMAIAAVALPIVWQLRRHAFFVARCVPALSGIVGTAGVYWFMARTLFA